MKKAYAEVWMELIGDPHSNRDELIFILNFLQPLCGPDFREWAMRTLPFFAKMQPEYVDLNPIDYLILRQQEIIDNLQRLQKKMKGHEE